MKRTSPPRLPKAHRHKDVDWHLPPFHDGDGMGLEPQEVQIALLMDLRDLLRELVDRRRQSERPARSAKGKGREG